MLAKLLPTFVFHDSEWQHKINLSYINKLIMYCIFAYVIQLTDTMYYFTRQVTLKCLDFWTLLRRSICFRQKILPPNFMFVWHWKSFYLRLQLKKVFVCLLHEIWPFIDFSQKLVYRFLNFKHYLMKLDKNLLIIFVRKLTELYFV